MRTISDNTWDFARASFLRSVQDLLDDPHGFVGQKYVPGVIAEYRILANELGYDFDNLVKELGTPFEVERLRKLEV